MGLNTAFPNPSVRTAQRNPLLHGVFPNGHRFHGETLFAGQCDELFVVLGNRIFQGVVSEVVYYGGYWVGYGGYFVGKRRAVSKPSWDGREDSACSPLSAGGPKSPNPRRAAFL